MADEQATETEDGKRVAPPNPLKDVTATSVPIGPLDFMRGIVRNHRALAGGIDRPASDAEVVRHCVVKTAVANGYEPAAAVA